MRQATNRAGLAESLKKDKMLLMRAYPMPAWMAVRKSLKTKDHLIINEQLAQLLSRGVPLIEALEVAAQTVPEHARATVSKLRDLVSSGSSFSEACRKVEAFDHVTIAVYRASERTGDLAGAAKQLATTQRRTLQVAGKAVTLMIYPVIVLSIALMVAFGMMVGIVPRMGETLREMGKVPWFSNLVISVGEWMSANVTLILLVLAGAVATVVFLRAPAGRLVGRISRSVPLLKDVILAQESVRFFSVLAAMSRSGVPLADGLGVANQAITHPMLKTQMERLRTRLIEGGQLRNLIEQVEALPLSTRKLLVAAERAGDLESAFNTLAMDMADEVDRRSQRFLAVLQPLLIVLMFVIIGTLLLALLIPMLNLSANIG
jgi:type II secretory pathway component PulF